MATGETSPGNRRLSLAEILRLTAPQYVARYGRQAAPQVQSTLAKLSLCRTAALGGHRYRCTGCDHECILYNSCGDRHCVQCGGAKRADWIESRQRLLLDGVDYFQVVFTLPSELSSLALGNRRAIYNLLFTSAWSALKETIETEQGYDAAALMVLHTWNQQLESHGHVHAVVPGGGPALDGSGWVTSRRHPTDGKPSPSQKRELYLVNAVDLRRSYRRHFLAGLARLRERGELKLEGEFAKLEADETWLAFVQKLESVEWVSHIQPPPVRTDGQACSAEQVLKYLARYLTGGPISEKRIISANENETTFWAREGKTVGGSRQQVPVTLSTLEFVRRWCLHILPKGYTKTRSYGGWHNRRRDEYLERCAILLDAIGAPLCEDALEFSVSAFKTSACDEGVESCETCTLCGSELYLLESRDKPSWSEIMSSAVRPAWYQRVSAAKLASADPPTIESAKGSKVCSSTKFNARSIRLSHYVGQSSEP